MMGDVLAFNACTRVGSYGKNGMRFVEKLDQDVEVIASYFWLRKKILSIFHLNFCTVYSFKFSSLSLFPRLLSSELKNKHLIQRVVIIVAVY